MSRSSRKTFFLALLVASLFPSSTYVCASIITITSNTATVDVRHEGSTASSTYRDPRIPASVFLNVNVGGYFSETQIDYSLSANGASLAYDFNQTRGDGRLSGPQDLSRSFSQMFFEVEEDTTYEALGNYMVSDVGSVAGRVFLYTFLFDLTSNTSLYNNSQNSNNTLNEAFTLGETEGDSSNHFSGSLTGTLLKDHTYYWYYEALIFGNNSMNSDAAASGSMTLNLGDSISGNSVPEPTSLVVWGLGLLGMTAGLRRRRRLRSL